MAAELDHLRVPDRDLGDVLDGDGARVVGQQVGGRPANDPQRRVQAGRQRAERLIPGRQHHPEPRPGQPGAKQLSTASGDPRPLSPIPLQPHARFGDPRPIDASPARPPGFLDRRHGSPGGALRAAKAHREQVLVHHVGPDLAARPLHLLLDLGQKGVDRLRPRRRRRGDAPGLAHRHVPLNGLRVASHQLRGRPRALGQVVGREDLHQFPVGFGHPRPSRRLEQQSSASATQARHQGNTITRHGADREIYQAIDQHFR